MCCSTQLFPRSSQTPYCCVCWLFVLKISGSLTQSNLLISISQPDTAGQILPSSILHLIKTRVFKALLGLGTISDSDQFKRQWIPSGKMASSTLADIRKEGLVFTFNIWIQPKDMSSDSNATSSNCLFGKQSSGFLWNRMISGFFLIPLGS